MSSRMPSDVASSGVKQQRQPPRTEMSSASRGSGAVHDALDSIDLRLHLHDLVPWPRRLCPAEAGRHSLGRAGAVINRCGALLGKTWGGQIGETPTTTPPRLRRKNPHDHIRIVRRGWLRRLLRRKHPAPASAWLRSDRRMPTRTVPENGSQTRPAPRGRLQLNTTAPSRKLRSPKWPRHFV